MFDCNFWKAEIFWLSDQVNTPLVFHSEPRLSMPGELQLQLTSLSSLRHSLKRTMKKTVCEEHRARCSVFSDLLLHIAIHCYMYHNLDELDLLCWSKSMFFPSVKLFILPPYLHALRKGFITVHGVLLLSVFCLLRVSEHLPCLLYWVFWFNEYFSHFADIKSKVSLLSWLDSSEAKWCIAVNFIWFASPVHPQIYLRFIDYQMEHSNECKKNFVAVYDGSSAIENLKAKFCSTVANDVMLNNDMGVVRMWADEKSRLSRFRMLFTSFIDRECQSSWQY